MTMDEDRRLSGLVVGGLAPVLLAMVLVALRDTVSNVNIALLLVIPVVAAAAVGGRAAGALGAVMAAASFDFFFTEPYLSLRIDAQDDVETALILLGVGLIVGTVAANAFRDQVSASEQRDELLAIHRVAELVADGASVPEVEQAACDEVATLLELRACTFERGDPVAPRASLDRRGAVAGSPRSYVATRRGFQLPTDGVTIEVLSRGRSLGRLVLEPTPGTGAPRHARLAAVVIADQLGTALHAVC